MSVPDKDPSNPESFVPTLSEAQPYRSPRETPDDKDPAAKKFRLASPLVFVFVAAVFSIGGYVAYAVTTLSVKEEIMEYGNTRGGVREQEYDPRWDVPNPDGDPFDSTAEST